MLRTPLHRLLCLPLLVIRCEKQQDGQATTRHWSTKMLAYFCQSFAFTCQGISKSTKYLVAFFLSIWLKVQKSGVYFVTNCVRIIERSTLRFCCIVGLVQLWKPNDVAVCNNSIRHRPFKTTFTLFDGWADGMEFQTESKGEPLSSNHRSILLLANALNEDETRSRATSDLARDHRNQQQRFTGTTKRKKNTICIEGWSTQVLLVDQRGSDLAI